MDLPYEQTDCSWDTWLDLDKLWTSLEKIGKDNCEYVFFTTTKHGYQLIQTFPNWFRYDLVWEKYTAFVYIFSGQGVNDIELNRILEMREDSKKKC